MHAKSSEEQLQQKVRLLEARLLELEQENAALHRAWRAQNHPDPTAGPGTTYDVLKTLDEGVALLDASDTIAAVNPAMERICSSGKGKLVGMPIDEFLADIRLAGGKLMTRRTLTRLAQDGRPTLLPATLSTKDNRKSPVILSAAHVGKPPHKRSTTVVVVRDMSQIRASQNARKRMEEEATRYREHIRSLGAMLATVEEEDRRRLSRHLHDTVIQGLSLSNIRLGAVRQALEEATDLQTLGKLDAARDLLSEGIKQCRLVMSDLSPPLLYELGVAPALRALAGRLAEQHGVTVRVAENGTGTAPMPLRGVLYQATRELIVNALKHSGSADIKVTLSWSGRAIGVRVTDNGDGFDTALLRRRVGVDHGGFGLTNIRARVRDLGGRFDIRSKPGNGTRIALSLPLAGRKRPQP